MRIFCFIVLNFLYFAVISQTGCTDPLANNYNSSATVNDGSCIYNVTAMSCSLKGSLTPLVNESSGLVYLNGIIWTHNDRGNSAEIFKVDTTTGAILQKVTIVNHPNTDWEDITADSTYIYIGDFGNNDGTRSDLKILRIRRDSISASANATVNATAINFSYSDQPSFNSNSSTNFDCESLISIGNFLYLFSKNRGDFQTRVYKMSKTPGTYTLAPYTSYNINGEITGATYNSQTNEVALVGYLSTKKNSFVWFLNDFSGDLFFSGNKRRVEIGNAFAKWQTEGITYTTKGSLFISCETSDYPAGLYSAYKPFATPVGLEEWTNAATEIKIYPNPSSDFITVESNSIISDVEIFSADEKYYHVKPGQSKLIITSGNFIFQDGLYFIKVISPGRSFIKKLVIRQTP